MKWSKLKQLAEALICDSLKGRVKYQNARYRDKNDNDGRGIITLDGKEILSACNWTYFAEQRERVYGTKGKTWAQYKEECKGTGINPTNKIKDRYDEVRFELKKEGIYCHWIFNSWLFEYVHEMDPQEVLKQEDNPLLQAFAVIDRRIGKKTLDNFEPKHPMVQTLWQARTQK